MRQEPEQKPASKPAREPAGHVIVTGAAGKLGRPTCRRLAAGGWRVQGLDRQTAAANPSQSPDIRIDTFDLLADDDPRPLAERFAGADAVVHLANHPSLWGREHEAPRIFNENVRMNIAVFYAAVQARVTRVVFASSVQVVGGWRTCRDPDAHPPLAYLPADGNLPANPGNLYALSKHFGEQMLEHLATRTGLSGVALRLPWLVDAESLAPLLRQRPTEIRPWQTLDEAFTFLRYEDAADLIAAILDSELPGFRVYFPAAGDPSVDLPVAELIRRWYPTSPLRRPLEQIDRLVDIEPIHRDTGWRPRLDRLTPAAPASPPTAASDAVQTPPA
jgi:nucleoside-diphosphate-sugar epimerase